MRYSLLATVLYPLRPRSQCSDVQQLARTIQLLHSQEVKDNLGLLRPFTRTAPLDGRADLVTKTFTVSGTISNDIYGMEIRDGSGNLRMSVGRRQPRLHAFVTGTVGTHADTQTITISGFNTPSPAEWHAVNVKDGSLYKVTQGTTANQLTLTHIEEDIDNFFTLSGTYDYELVIMRY